MGSSLGEELIQTEISSNLKGLDFIYFILLVNSNVLIVPSSHASLFHWEEPFLVISESSVPLEWLRTITE